MTQTIDAKQALDSGESPAVIIVNLYCLLRAPFPLDLAVIMVYTVLQSRSRDDAPLLNAALFVVCLSKQESGLRICLFDELGEYLHGSQPCGEVNTDDIPLSCFLRIDQYDHVTLGLSSCLSSCTAVHSSATLAAVNLGCHLFTDAASSHLFLH